MSKKILLVDDEPDILKVVMFRLKKTGHEIICAEDGKKAWELLQSEKPDLVFLDHLLPEMSGGEICSKAKKDDSLKHIPIILLSACADVVIKKAEEFGADGYLIKPFDSQKLLEQVEAYLGEG